MFQASVTLPSSTTQVTRRCPSMRVIGSITTLVFAITHPPHGSARLRLRRARLLRLARRVRPARALRLVHRPAAAEAVRDRRADQVRADGHGGPADEDLGERRVGDAADARRVDVGRRRVEGGHVVPEVRLGAADARAGLDAPALVAVPAGDGAGGVGDRALAAHLEPAPLVGAVLVAERLDVLAVLEVRPALAVVVHQLAVEEQRPAHRVERRHLLVDEDVGEHRQQVLGVARAAGHVDHDRVRDAGVLLEEGGEALGPGRVGVGGLDAAVGGAGADGDGGLGLRVGLFGDVHGRPAVDGHRPRHLGRDGALGHPVEVAALHRLGEALLGLVPGRGHDGLVVVERDLLQDQGRHLRGAALQQVDRTAQTLLEVRPDDVGSFGDGFERLGDVGGAGLPEADERRQSPADLEEVPPGHPWERRQLLHGPPP